jgi:hypothetical protein
MVDINRRGLICGVAAIATLGITKQSAVAAIGIKTLAHGKTEIDLASNSALSKVGGVVQLTISKYEK